MSEPASSQGDDGVEENRMDGGSGGEEGNEDEGGGGVIVDDSGEWEVVEPPVHSEVVLGVDETPPLEEFTEDAVHVGQAQVQAVKQQLPAEPCSDDEDNEDDAAEASSGAAPGIAATTASMPLPLHWTRLGLPLPVPQVPGADSSSEPQPPCDGTTSPAPVVIRCPQDVVMDPIDPLDSELVIVGTAGQKITSMGRNLQDLLNPNLEQLVLRSHLIHDIQGIDRLRTLELLELYDNQLASLDGLALAAAVDEGDAIGDDTQEESQPESSTTSSLRLKLRVLDVSYNVIRDMDPVQLCPNLQELYLANNKLKAMAGLEKLSQLKKLDLGANRIRFMDPVQLQGLISLEELWLGKNKIEAIQGLEPLHKLRRLDLQSNRLTSIENLTSQVDTLEELYLSHNGIDTAGCSNATGLALPFTSLTVLDVSRNRVDSTAPFAHLSSLEELWLSGNNIATFDDVQPASRLTNLETIYLEHNPVQGSDPLYRKTLAALIPNLKQIDANMITAAPMSVVAPPPAPSHSPRAATTSAVVVSEADELRMLQEAALQRARAETEEKKKLQQQQEPTQPPTGDEQAPPQPES